MTLIKSLDIDGVRVNFFDGIDFKIAIEHPKDGSNGFIYFLIDDWVSEVESFNREIKISHIVDDENFTDFDWERIENDYLFVYQASGVDKMNLCETLIKKINITHNTSNWFPVAGINGGLKIGKSKSWN